MDFPAKRIEQAGATAKEITRLQETEQSWEHFETIAEGDIRDWLAGLRKSGYFKAPKADTLETETPPEDTEKIVEEVEGHDDQQDSTDAPDAPEKDETPPPEK
jgi:hypothetical protein